MTPGEVAGSPLEQFAAERLGLAAGAPPGALHEALLRRLRAEEYLPDPVAHEAMLLLSGGSAGPTARLAEEMARRDQERLTGEIEEFASGFFATPVPERNERWQSLVQACTGHDLIQERLHDLASGLTIDRRTLSDPSAVVNRLADMILTLFVLRPGPRAVVRRELLHGLRTDPSLEKNDVTRGVKRLLKVYPDVARISHGLLPQLAQPRRRFRRSRVWTMQLGDRQLVSLALLALFAISFVARLPSFLRTEGPRPVSLNSGPFTPSGTHVQPSILLDSLIPGKQAPSAKAVKSFRDKLKDPIRRELAKYGKSIDEDRLQKVADGLPPPTDGGLAWLTLTGQWTEQRHQLYVTRLKEGLRSAELGLNESELEVVARGSIPAPIQQSPPSSEPTGGKPSYPNLGRGASP